MRRGLVYSTEHGRMCPGCGWPVEKCACSRKDGPETAAGPVRVRLETKGRKGKGVTVVTGLPLTTAELAVLAKDLKKKCGSGGTVKNGTIEIQGDHRDVVVEHLNAKGWKAKKAGG